ncbi:MAG: hypothetical protein Q7T76_20850 [Ferruginibacter sp.]|nr:hypothetical protein [Ferruginibacter sp.]
MTKLVGVKLVHTIIWICFNLILFYLAYAVIVDKIDRLLWFCIGTIVLEGMVLLYYKGTCPLTLIARKYSTSTKPNFDIYLPAWLARYNKLIYTTFFVIIVAALIYRMTIASITSPI